MRCLDGVYFSRSTRTRMQGAERRGAEYKLQECDPKSKRVDGSFQVRMRQVGGRSMRWQQLANSSD